MLEVREYTIEDKQEWNRFVANGKNATFLHNRDYMDYHSQYFQDFSLIITRDNKIQALLPANRIDNTLYSHSGLTYAGLIMGNDVTAISVLEIFKEINIYLRLRGIKHVIYKPSPYIYHTVASQEDLYAIFNVCKAKLISCEISSTIYADNSLKWRTLRRRQYNKAIKAGVNIKQSDDVSSFWRILKDTLWVRHGVRPVHSESEMKLLMQRFPQNIRLYTAYTGNIMTAGILLYITNKTVHSQYLASSDIGRKNGSLDAVIHYVIEQELEVKNTNQLHQMQKSVRSQNPELVKPMYFDFGKSTEEQGQILNEGLIFQKEGYGARAVCYDTYAWEV